MNSDRILSLAAAADVGKSQPCDSHAERFLRLVRWTSAASRQLRKRLGELAAAFELSDTELLVVWLCSGGGRVQVELAGAIGVSPAQMSGMVERLRSRGLVGMHRSAMDRRRQVCRTTAEGETLLARASNHLTEITAVVGTGLSETEQEKAQELCERLAGQGVGGRGQATGDKSQGSGVGQIARAAAAVLLVCVLISSGCSRTFWRRQADIDAYGLVREKATHPHWRLPNYTISVDPRSRMYDPYAIDCPPIPPDDPTAHQLMHCVDNHRGWPFWHDNGDRPFVENPAWPEYVNVDEQGVLKLDRDDAVRLALLHSREYQQQLETVYLSALDVSVERFRFDSQFFAGYSVFGTWTGPGVTGNSSSVLQANTFTRGLGGTGGAPGTGVGTNAAGNQFAVNKAFTTGGSLLVDFANSLMWQVSGPDRFDPTTIINYSLVQPLLRGAGRDRVLETLTLSERGLLYNVRIMEQYRQAFYVDTVVGGGTNGSTPQRLGGVQGQGLAGFQGIGGTGFGNVVTQGGGQGTQAAQGANNASFTGLLQQQRLIRNQEDAIRRLRRNLTRLTTLLEQQPSQATADYLTQALQVAQTRQALLLNETQLITNRNQFQANVDQFKVNELALPPQICMVPSDPLLDPFDLIEQEIIRLPEDWEGVLLNNIHVRREIPERIQANVESTPIVGGAAVCRLPRYAELDDDLVRLRPALAEMHQFADKIMTVYLPAIEEDLQRFRAAVPRRKEYLQRLIERINGSLKNPCDLLPLGVDPLEAAAGGLAAQDLMARLDASLANTERSYQNLSANFGRYAGELARRGKLLEDLIENKEQTPEQLFELLVRNVFNPQYECGKTRVLSIDVVEDITRELIELQLLQAVARAETIEINEVDMRAERALEVARRYRRDWMNQRANLVDRWRRLQFQADQLQAELDVFFSGSIENVNDNVFSLRPNTGPLRVGVQFDAPLTRLQERNSYRQSLIEYQQARRTFYNFEDGVAQVLRGQLRQLASFQINFELNRLAVIEAARQVMLNTFIDQESQRLATTRVTAARDVVQALSDLLTAQNNFMLIFISYEVQRLQLDFALGTMQLDNEGLWIDPGKIGPEYGEFDPWLWRHSPGSIDHNESKDDSAKQVDDALEQLPPPFMLPQGEREVIPPLENPPRRPRTATER
jgi:DNA-binding MarR family transcriptional regulator